MKLLFEPDKLDPNYNNLVSFGSKYNDLDLEILISKALNKIELGTDEVMIWCEETSLWASKNINETQKYVETYILDFLKEMESIFRNISIYYFDPDSIALQILRVKFQLFDGSKIINQRITSYIDATEKKKHIIKFNNIRPFYIAYLDKFVLNLETREIRLRTIDDYFSSTVTHYIKESNNIYPIYEWFNSEDLKYIQLILGSFLTGENDKLIYIFSGNGCNGKNTLIRILKNILGDYFIYIPHDVFFYKNIKSLQNDYKLDNKRLAVFDSEQEINVPQLLSIIEKYKTCKFLICQNEISTELTTKYSIARKVINIYFPFTFKVKPIFPKEKKIKKYLDIDYDGIFNWLLKGCSEYIKSKQHILELVSEYIEANSVYENTNFDNFILTKTVVTNNNKDVIGFRELYQLYEQYEKSLGASNSKTLKEKEFLNLGKAKFPYKKLTHGHVFYKIKKSSEVKTLQDTYKELESILKQHELTNK